LEVDARSANSFDEARGAAGYLVTGSSSSVTERATWMLRTEAFLRDLVKEEAPVLGICFGHQILAQALGGEVAKNPRGREIGTVSVARSEDDPLFEGIGAAFLANMSHMDTVAQLPRGARVLARTDLDPVAAYALGPRARCVQFHPEFDGDVMRGYVRARAHLITREGSDPDAIHARATDTPDGARLLRNFVAHFVPR
jgi:GMP synthase (glutamine-hydrolysing)